MLDVSSYYDCESSDDEFNDSESLLWLNQSLMRRRVIELAKEIELEEIIELEQLAMHARLKVRANYNRRRLQEYMDHDDGDVYMQAQSSGSSSPDLRHMSRTPPSPLSPMNRKRRSRLCRHFLKGHCKRGSSCDFLHDSSIFCPDSQKVFLGGLPATLTSDRLIRKLGEMGYTVINKPKVLRGFTPQVCFASIEQAQQLMEMGKILIDGSMCDVRPYEDKKPPDSIKKSVFLGGLPTGLKVKEIKESLQALGVTVCNYPILKNGFSPQVVLATPEQAQRLVKLRRVSIAGKLVEVRPYVNFRKRY